MGWPAGLAVARSPRQHFIRAEKQALDQRVVDFMASYDVPGMSIAVARHGRMVLAQGYGVSDRATGTPVERGHLFRVASISKPITAVAVMRLVEQGRLRLTDRVFGAGALLGTIYGSKPYGPDIEAITVRHLLEHTAGGWSNDENDPMFWHPEFNNAELIGWVLDDRPASRLLKNYAKWDRQIDPVVLRCSQH